MSLPRIPSGFQTLINDLTPRYTLFDLNKFEAGFDFFEGDIYWQGLANYGLWILTGLLILNIVLTCWGLTMKAICLTRPYWFARQMLMTSVMTLGLLCLKFVILCLIGAVIAFLSFKKFNNKLKNALLNNVACGYVTEIGGLYTTLTGFLLNGATMTPRATAVAEALGDGKVKAEVGKIDTYVTSLTDGMESGNLSTLANNTAESIKYLCTPSQAQVIKLLAVDDYAFYASLGLCVLSAALGGLITKSIKFRSKIVMTLLAVIAWITMCLWGVAASILFMVFLTINDICNKPFDVAKLYMHNVNPVIDKNLTEFYLGCKGVNPLKENFTMLQNALEPLKETTEKLVAVFQLHRSIEPFGGFAKEYANALRQGLHLAKKVVDTDCRHYQKQCLKMLKLPCRNVYWGIGTMFLMAVLIALTLAVFVMICMRIRKFLHAFVPPKPPPIPEDVCPGSCPGPEADLDTPLYFMPEVPKPPETECPPSCEAYPAILRRFTSGLTRKQAKRAERFACSPECKKIYYDENGYILPPECVPVEDKSIETENAYMCTQTLKAMKKNKLTRKNLPPNVSQLIKANKKNISRSQEDQTEDPVEKFIQDTKVLETEKPTEADKPVPEPDKPTVNEPKKNKDDAPKVKDNPVSTDKATDAPKGFKLHYFSINKSGRNLAGVDLHKDVTTKCENPSCKGKAVQDKQPNKPTEASKPKYDNTWGKPKATTIMKVPKANAAIGVKCRNCRCLENLHKYQADKSLQKVTESLNAKN